MKLVYIEDKLVIILYCFTLIFYAVINPFLFICRGNLFLYICLFKAPRTFSILFKHCFKLVWFNSNIKVFNLSLKELITDWI